MLDIHLDTFITRPDEQDAINCRVCGRACRISRYVVGPTSWATAMARKHTPHDAFVCYYAEQEWHQQAKALVVERDKTNSARLRAFIQADLDELLAAHLPSGNTA